MRLLITMNLSFSSTSVFLRLLGEEYSAQYENLVTEMEMHYFNENDFPSVLQPQVCEL